jgi:hypothetical protein
MKQDFDTSTVLIATAGCAALISALLFLAAVVAE